MYGLETAELQVTLSWHTSYPLLKPFKVDRVETGVRVEKGLCAGTRLEVVKSGEGDVELRGPF